jgi:hypothetical protein
MTYVEETGHVIYRSKMTPGKNRRNFEVHEAQNLHPEIRMRT